MTPLRSNDNDIRANPIEITLRSEDIPHSFVIDASRIAKKAAGGGSVSFEFLADRSGEFPFYCNLHNEDGCRNMKGTLVVRGEGAR